MSEYSGLYGIQTKRELTSRIMEKNKDEEIYMKKQRVFEASQARHVNQHHKLLQA